MTYMPSGLGKVAAVLEYCEPKRHTAHGQSVDQRGTEASHTHESGSFRTPAHSARPAANGAANQPDILHDLNMRTTVIALRMAGDAKAIIQPGDLGEMARLLQSRNSRSSILARWDSNCFAPWVWTRVIGTASVAFSQRRSCRAQVFACLKYFFFLCSESAYG